MDVRSRGETVWHVKVYYHLLWIDHQTVLWNTSQQDPRHKEKKGLPNDFIGKNKYKSLKKIITYYIYNYI